MVLQQGLANLKLDALELTRYAYMSFSYIQKVDLGKLESSCYPNSGPISPGLDSQHSQKFSLEFLNVAGI